MEQEATQPPVESIVLEIVTGPRSGQRIWLRPSQRTAVGRTQDSDFMIAEDRQISSIHFIVECKKAGCQIVDCSSANGTFVNGRRIEAAALADGDQIKAGATTFDVAIVGGPPRGENAEASIPSGNTTSDIKTAKDASIGRYLEQKYVSGISAYFAVATPPPPRQMVRILAEVAPGHLIVHFPTLQLPTPQDLLQGEFLFDWLPQNVAAQQSPIIFSPQDASHLDEIITLGWDADAIICVFSSLDQQALAEHFRAVARGYFLPSVLANVLTFGEPQTVNMIMQDIDAVLVEAADPYVWQIFARGEFREQLNNLGFVSGLDDS